MSSGNNNELEYLKGLVSQVSPNSLFDMFNDVDVDIDMMLELVLTL